ncbi:TolC family protein [Sulfurimonas sp.]|uniref:TolC family protein n=1 Tax=Sulfurimonas sp. TaxID=2022749 RepID=UPI0025F5E578|nr:TolC family protein [Sulfurimonas sp.]
MIKILSAVVLISASLFAQDFDTFLNNALKNSTYLKSSNLSIAQVRQQGLAMTRYKNPSLDLEYSEFRPDASADDNGYRAAITQPIRLWGVNSDTQAYVDASIKKTESTYSLSYAEFTRDISILYTEYAKQKRQLELGNEELSIAKNIYEISEQRSLAGTISKGLMLQAQVDYEMAEIKTQTLNLDIQETYFELLKFAGISKEIELEYNHEFKLISDASSLINPDINYLKSYKEEAKADVTLNSNSVKWIDLSAEYEIEPDQNVMRIGASIPLTIFNTSSEEMQVAKLEADKTALLIENEKAKISIENIKLKKQRNLLKILKSKNEETLKTQTKLLKMFEDGYKIASINLLELQNIKNRVIKTKESLIKIDTALNQNAITTNYISGAYNE